MNKKYYVIFDIDGTLAFINHRLHHITGEKKDWDAFYKACPDDMPNAPLCELASVLALSGYHIIFCTGRSETVRTETANWLKQWVPHLDSYRILMRAEGDHRPDVLVKPQLLQEAGIDMDEIAFVVEDRTSVVKEWRKRGVLVLQCDEGNF